MELGGEGFTAQALEVKPPAQKNPPLEEKQPSPGLNHQHLCFFTLPRVTGIPLSTVYLHVPAVVYLILS